MPGPRIISSYEPLFYPLTFNQIQPFFKKIDKRLQVISLWRPLQLFIDRKPSASSMVFQKNHELDNFSACRRPF